MHKLAICLGLYILLVVLALPLILQVVQDLKKSQELRRQARLASLVVSLLVTFWWVPKAVNVLFP